MELLQKIRNLGKLRQPEKLETLLAALSLKEIIAAAEEIVNQKDATACWNHILTHWNTDERTGDLFKIILAVLNQLNKVEVSQKQSFDLIIRMFSELPRFNEYQLIELVEFCVETMRLGDPKCVGWKDLLPELLKLIEKRPTLTVNGVPMSGQEYRELCVRQIGTMRLATTILTPLTMMFRDIPLAKEEKSQILLKVCDNLNDLEPTELPPLAHQLFMVATSAALIMIPIYGFNRYFQKHFYKPTDMDSDVTDYDSIDKYSPKEMQEAQETILYHLSKASEFRIDEKDIVNFCKTIAASPRCLLSPFFVCALLSMSHINRYPESVLLSSALVLPFMRSVLRSNEAESEMCQRSAWSRGTLDRNCVDSSRMLEVLIDQSKDGLEIVTPGLVWLAFAMLKSSNCSTLHSMAIGFLEKFVKKRFIFGQGVVKNLVVFQLADLDAVQYTDCLTRLSLTNTYTVSESLDTIQRVLDYLLLVPGAQAMRMMSFIVPLCKSSQKIRDLFIEILRKAMNGRDSATRQMGVYGFCLVLKHLRENNSRRAITGATTTQQIPLSGSGRFGLVFSQQSISGYSLMSQTILDNDQNPQRFFDMLALEIIGILRKCFNQTYEVKQVLYEGLARAIDFNPKLAPHIVQFLESHLQKYVGLEAGGFELRIGDVVRDLNGTLSVWDHVGHLVQLMGRCVVVCKEKGVAHDLRAMVGLLETMMQRMDDVPIENQAEQMDLRLMHIGSQYLNCLEAVMGYAIWSKSADKVSNIGRIPKLFTHHTRSMYILQQSNIRKKAKKVGKDKSSVSQIEATPKQAACAFNPVNIWDMATLIRFLSVLLNPEVPFATAEQTAPLRTNVELVRYCLRVAVHRMETLPAHAEERHIKHSQSTFVQLCQITNIVYHQCVVKLASVCERFDVETAQLGVDCFRECLQVAVQLYPRRLNQFLQTLILIKTPDIGSTIHTIVTVLQNAVDLCLGDTIDDDSHSGSLRIPHILLRCLDMLLEHLPAASPTALETYSWLYQTCLEHNVDDKPMELIHKLLFEQRVRTSTGSFFDSVALQIELLVNEVEEEPPTKPVFVLKSITLKTLDSCLLHLNTVLRAQIEDVEHFIAKAKCLLAKLRIVGPSSVEPYIQTIKSTERKICSQLILIAHTIQPLTNIGIPSGHCSDGVVKNLIQFYVCLSNLTKHLIVRHGSVPVSYQTIRFDRLVRSSGRPLAARIYDLIEHIENSVFADEKYTKNPAADRAKVLRATRLLPKLVLRIENFNKFVLLLGKKTKHDLSELLHVGTVRDFKIRRSAFRENIEKASAEDGPDDETLLDQADEEEAWEDPEEEVLGDFGSADSEEEQTVASIERQLSATDISATCTSQNGTLIEVNDADMKRPQVLLKNVAMINARLRRKRSLEKPSAGNDEAENDPAVNAAPATAKKKKKPRKPIVINKDVLKKNVRSSRRNSSL